MFRSTLTAVQLKEDLLLDYEPKVFVSRTIAQYLLNHQLNGIRFMYRHFKNAESAILNDIDGAGKCFQCVAFFDAIFRSVPGSHVLIVCERKPDLDHWHYHIDSLLDNLTVSLADEQRESQIGQSTSGLNKITLVSSAYAVDHLNQMNAELYNYLVLHDPHMRTTAASFARLKEIQVAKKIVLCNRDMVENLSYFYEVLKFCNRYDAPLIAGNKTKHLTEHEFKMKYGDDRSISKRNQIFRQRGLLNVCNNFYLRRVGSNLTNPCAPIDAEVFRKKFETWRETLNPKITQTTIGDENSESQTIIGMKKTQKDTENSQIDENSVSFLNTASIDLDDFDTQMSPLIYSDSDTEDIGADAQINQISIQASGEYSTQPNSSIACNQEHAAKNENKIDSPKLPIVATRKHLDRSIINNNKRMSYKQLSVTINSSRSSNTKTKNIANELLSFMEDDDDDADRTQRLLNEQPSHRRISSASDIQILSDGSSPITISSNSTSADDNKNNKKLSKNEMEVETQLAATEPSSSPDLFSSFNSTRTEIPNDNPDKTIRPKRLQDLFGEPDECDEIDLSSHSNIDVFEITKNNVFENVLCSAKDRITPTIRPTNKKRRPACTTVQCATNRNCLSGLRIVLPKLNEVEVERIRNELQSQSNSQGIEVIEKSADIIDLTSSQNDMDDLIESNFALRSIERTPERKQELTPSTRSCLKRSSPTCIDKANDEKRRRTALETGWISTKRSPSATGTPLSRRRLEKWLNRTKDSQIDEDSVKVSKPRNLFKEFKSRSSNRKRRKCTASSSTDTQSPNIFSDPDD